MTLLNAITMLVILVIIGWIFAPSSKDSLDRLLTIGKNRINVVTYRLLESPEYTVRSYSGRLDVLKNETRSSLEPLYKNLTCEERKYISRNLGYHIAQRAKLIIPTN